MNWFTVTQTVIIGTVSMQVPPANPPTAVLYAIKGDPGDAATGGGGGAVASVNGQTGIVVLAKGDLGLGNVDNTADASKPVSTAQAAADAVVLAAAAADATTKADAKVVDSIADGDTTHAPSRNAVFDALATKADLVGGVLATSQIPALAITKYLGTAADQAAMLALAGQEGDWAIRSDLGTVWFITGPDPTQLVNWTALSYPTAPVLSVNGATGVVVLSKTDVGLSSVTNDAQTKAAIVPNTAPSAGQLLLGNAGGTAYAPISVTGDVTISSAGVTAIGAGKVTEAMQVLADNTTGNASTSAHGYLKKLSNVATEFMNGQGNWATPAGGGGSGPFDDGTAIIKGSADATKLLRFEVDGFTTATTRVLTPPNADATIAGLEVSQTFTGQNTFAAGTITTSQPITVTQTWNAAGVPFTSLLVNVTSSASAAASLLADLQVAGATKFNVKKDGSVVCGVDNNLTNSIIIGGSTSVMGFSAGPSNNGSRAFFNYNGSAFLGFSAGFITFPTGTACGVRWTNSNSNGGAQALTYQTGISESGAGVVEINNGTAGSLRDAKLRNIIGQTGYHELVEMSAPGVGAADTARLYAVDNGAGKTQLMVIFASGAAQQLAIQP